jgi:hypothetical protein
MEQAIQQSAAISTTSDPLERQLQKIWDLYDNAYLFQAKKKIVELNEQFSSEEHKRKISSLLAEPRYRQLHEECTEAEYLIGRLTSDEGTCWSSAKLHLNLLSQGGF